VRSSGLVIDLALVFEKPDSMRDIDDAVQFVQTADVESATAIVLDWRTS
jgi:hypothetical protein